jgi:RimJ/RimL family protein N-acetyltransferase
MQEINTERVETERLLLRRFNLKDAKNVQQLANDEAVSEGTYYLPYPYEDGVAERWITNHRAAYDKGEQIVFAITLKETGVLVGAVGLFLDHEAELGYWLGRPYWGHGYATEAARAMIEYGFNVVGLKTIFADCFKWNKISIKVMRKIGMTYRKTFDKYVEKYHQFEPVDQYEINNNEKTMPITERIM